jgi:hypothetical protein
VPVQLLLAVVIPAVFGAICGWVLGLDKTVYLVLSVLAFLGAYAAGNEHKSALEGALRGLIGGALFGTAILLVNDAIGKKPKATLPDPKIWLLAITIGVAVVMGALGGRARANHTEVEKREGPPFNIKLVKRSELIGFAGATILLISLFLNWFSTSCTQSGMPKGCNQNSQMIGASPHRTRGSFDAFQTFKILDWLLLAACIAPFVLAYIIARGHELTWRPGEITMIVGIVAFALILVNGVILGRPGGDSPANVDINIEPGYLVGLIGAAVLAYGGFVRQAQSIRGRKPPGVM